MIEVILFVLGAAIGYMMRTPERNNNDRIDYPIELTGAGWSRTYRNPRGEP
jgi:hypothetical protein